MNTLLADLLKLLYDNMVVIDKTITSIHILDTFSMETLLKVQHLPAIVISATTERHEQGPFTNTAREIYVLRLRLIARSVDVNAYQVVPVAGVSSVTNIFSLSNRVRDILYQNKRLNAGVFEMRPRFDCVDLNVLWSEKSGQYSARDIYIEYTKLELYDGMQNEQSSLTIPSFEF